MESKSPRYIDPEEIYDALVAGRALSQVTLSFKDGREVTGTLVFNAFKATGRVINVDQTLSVDFSINDIRDVKT